MEEAAGEPGARCAAEGKSRYAWVRAGAEWASVLVCGGLECSPARRSPQSGRSQRASSAKDRPRRCLRSWQCVLERDDVEDHSARALAWEEQA